MCVGCRTVQDKSRLLRIIKTTDERVDIDESGKRDGRGAYICKNVECVKKAAKRRQFDRAFKSKINDEIYEKLMKYFNEMSETKNNRNE